MMAVGVARSLLYKVDLMNQVRLGNFLDPDEHVKDIGIAHVLSDRDLESTFRRTGMLDSKISRRVLFEKIAKHNFRLRFAVGTCGYGEVHVNGSIKELHDLFGIARLDSLLHRGKHILRTCCESKQNKQESCGHDSGSHNRCYFSKIMP